jgi:hypothetical protein
MLSSKRTAAGTSIGSTHRIHPAPEAVFQSPKLQPNAARASDGRASSNSFDNFEIKMGDRDHFAHNLWRAREDHFP